jgi:hypothetical protein
MKKYKILISNYTYADYNKSQMPLTALDKYRNSFVLLFNTGWNDMGFYSEFLILYVDNEAVPKQIGLIKLCNKEMKLDNIYPYSNAYYFLKNDTLIERELSSDILNNYYSIIGMDTYNSLLDVLKEDAEVTNFISELHEVSTLSNDTINEIKNYDWFKDSILRDSNISQRRNKMIVSFTELKNEIKIRENSYYALNNLSKLIKSPSENTLEKIYNWVIEYYNYISINQAKEIVLIINENKKKTISQRNEILRIFKIKFESYTDFLREIDNILNINQEIYTIIENIKDILRVREVDLSNLELGHYTSLSTVSKLINKDGSYLRLTNGRQMNDPLEGKNLLEFIFNDSDHYWKPTKRFISSLTTKKDSLPMWNSYAEGTTGAMLIYDKTYLKEISILTYIDIYKVVYIYLDSDKNKIEIKSTDNLKDQDIDALIDNIHGLKALINSEIGDLNGNEKKDREREYIDLLQEIDFLFKKSDYSYEAEYRIIANTEDRNSTLKIESEYNGAHIFPFLYCYLKDIKLKYSKLILGSKSINIDYIAPYVNHCDENIKIELSKINFR